MKNKKDIIIYGTFLIVLVLLNLIVLRLDNSSYSFSEKKLGKNIVYPHFKDKKDEIIQNYISDYQNENYKINYSLGKADNYTSVLFKFFNNEDKIVKVHTLLLDKEGSLVNLNDLIKEEDLRNKIIIAKENLNLNITNEQISKAEIDCLFNEKDMSIYLSEYNDQREITFLKLDYNEVKDYSNLKFNLNKDYTPYTTTKAVRNLENKKLVAFTFDDGPSKYTLDIISTLEKYDAKATFFEVGYNIKSHKDIVKEVYNRGFEIANHTIDHSKLTKLTIDKMLGKVNDNNELYKGITDADMPYLRPPYGSYNADIKAAVNVPLILWSLDTRDWESRNTEKIKNMVLENIQDGDIILFHDLYETTKNAVEELMPILTEQGYAVVSVSELFTLKNKTLVAGESYRSAR